MIWNDFKSLLRCYKATRVVSNSLPAKKLQEANRANKEIGPGFFFNLPEGEAPAQRTIVVMGSYRGGTSMVAGTLRLFGVFMGRLLGKTNNEDLDFQEFDAKKIREVIAERNSTLDIWGWKFPGSIDHIDEIAGDLRNPFYIIICRDPVAIAQREHFLENYTAGQALHVASTHQNKLLNFVFNCSDPVYLVSYERVMRQKEDFVHELSAFVNANRAEDDLKKISRYLVAGGGMTVSEFCRNEELTEVIELEERLDIQEIKGGRQGLKEKYDTQNS